MKGNTNIQVNGNVYGGIHVNGGPAVACLPSTEPQQGHHAGTDLSWVWWLAKGLGWLVVGAFALVGGLGLAAALLVVALCALALALSWWVLCRVANGVLLTERALGGSPMRLVFVPNLANAVRELATGDRVNEIETTEMTRYVD